MSNLYRYTTCVRINLILLKLSVIDLFSVLGLILAFFFFFNFGYFYTVAISFILSEIWLSLPDVCMYPLGQTRRKANISQRQESYFWFLKTYTVTLPGPEWATRF